MPGNAERQEDGVEVKKPILRISAPEINSLGDRFNHLTNLLREHGALVGTAHKRLLIPKNKLTESDLSELKFEPVTVAVPEAGQDRFRSFRHPENLFHIHSHPEGWTMHEDRHPAATMLSRRAESLKDKAKLMLQGIPHVSDEGLPGLYYYGKGLVTGTKSTAQRLMAELHPDLQKHLGALPDSASFSKEKEAAYEQGALRALNLFKKEADHADDRMRERIRAEFPADALDQLRIQAKDLELAPGRYYFPMKDSSGTTSAVAAFKTVGPKDELVLATVLAPKNKPPPGKSLSHLLRQPFDESVAKKASTEIRHAGEPIGDTEEPRTEEAPMQKKEKKKSWLPTLGAGALAGLGTYALLRNPSKSPTPSLAKFQTNAVRKGFHRVVDLSRDPSAKDQPLNLLNQFKKVRSGEMGPGKMLKNTLENLSDRWQPKVDMETRTMSPLNKLKFWMQEGGEAIPISSDPKTLETFVPGAPRGIKIKGVAANRHVMPYYGEQSPAKLIRGGTDVEGSEATQRAMTLLGTKGKGYEAAVVQKHAPGAMPQSVSDLTPFFKKRIGNTARDRIEAIGQIQQKMRQDFVSKGMPDFAIKPTGGVQSAGAFPLGKDNWRKQLTKFEAHIQDPKRRAALEASERAGAGEMAYYLGHHDLLEGHTLHNALKDPKSIMAQHWLPGAMGEWRVNTLQGAAPESMMTPRYFSGDPAGAAKDLLGLGNVNRGDLRKFVEDHLEKMPKDLRKGTYGLDVMPFKGPDGKPYFKMLEMNPSERAGIGGSQGGGSGFLDSANVPWAGHAHYRAATGRHTEPVAGLGGLAAAGAAAGLARYLTPEQKAEQENEEAPHPAG